MSHSACSPTRDDLLVGVDLGGTKIAASLVTTDGELVGEIRQIATPARRGREAMLDAIADLIITVLGGDTASHNEPSSSMACPWAVGIGSAGIIDADSGLILSATDAIAEWTGTDLAGGLYNRLYEAGVRCPDGSAVLVHADNDVNAYAAGEAWKGAGRGAPTALVVAVGTGVGGALILDGSVHHGQHFLAGEMGHMPTLMAAGEPCTCGKSGHVEAVAAGPQIARRYREATGDATVTTALEVEKRAEAGDEVARAVYTDSAVALGRAIAQVCTVLDPHTVIVSGGLARSGDLWWGPLRRTVQNELIDLISDSTVLHQATLGTTAPIIGASHEAWLRRQKSHNLPARS